MTLPAQATVLATLAKLLEEEGFQQFGRTWRRQRPESVHVVSIQAMGSGRRMFLNAGVYLREMGDQLAPAEHDCHIRIGAEDIASRPLMLQRALDFDSGFDVERREQVLLQVLQRRVLPWLEGHGTRRGARRALSRGDIPAWPTDQVLRDLGLSDQSGASA